MHGTTRRWQMIMAAAMLAATGWTTAQAGDIVETFDAGKPPAAVLGGVAKTGTDGAWVISLVDGAYVWRNDGDPQAVRYIHIDATSDDADGFAGAAVEVDVTIGERGDGAAAGVVYRFDPASRTYLLFTLLGDGQYAVLARGRQGLKQVGRGTVPGVKPGANRLMVRTVGDKIEYLVNGARAVEVDIRGAAGRSVGIAAIGKGTFTFDNLAVREAG